MCEMDDCVLLKIPWWSDEGERRWEIWTGWSRIGDVGDGRTREEVAHSARLREGYFP